MCQLLVTFDCADTSILHILRNEKYQIYIKYDLFYVFSDEKHPFLPDSKNYISISGEKYNKCRDNCTICRLVMEEQILQFECTLFWYDMPEKHEIERQTQKMNQSCVCKLWVVQ